MAVTGTETYTTVYTYDANNRLLTESKTENSETVTTTYTYDANGNTLTKSTPAHGEDEASGTTYTYNGFNQLIALTVDGTSVAYAYNAQGIRTAKRVNNLRTAYLLDGGNVVAEVQNNAVTDNYLRGVNLIRRTSSSETEYYLFNAHGDVVTTTNPNGTVNQSYDYDAFGNEKNPDALDTNPFRYCGEYLDAETGDYYLRARYYNPTTGRFTQQDTHWNTANMIYGDALQLSNYTYIPQITAIMQSGNLYVYGINSPTAYVDHNGCFINTITGAIIGGLIGAIDAHNKGQNVFDGALIGAAFGAASGAFVDFAVATGGGIAFAVATIAGGALGAGSSMAKQIVLEGRAFSDMVWEQVAADAVIGAAAAALSFGVSSGSLEKSSGSIWKNLRKNAVDTLMEGTTKTVSQNAVNQTAKVISKSGGKAIVRKSSATVIKRVIGNSAVQLVNTAIISGGGALASDSISRKINPRKKTMDMIS